MAFMTVKVTDSPAGFVGRILICWDIAEDRSAAAREAMSNDLGDGVV